MVDMGKFYLYYKKHNDLQVGDVLKVKIDDSIVAEVYKNDIYELELMDGMHNIKMYFEGWTSNDLMGYIDQNIEVSGNVYYVYTAPMILTGKGKFENFQFQDVDSFKKYVSKKNKSYKIIGIILFIIALLFLLLFG